MITICSIEELTAAEEAFDTMKKNYPALFNKLVEIVNLTRALQFKYQYMASLLMDENPNDSKPNYVYDSVLRLYKRELQKVKEDPHFEVLKHIFSQFKNIGYAKLCLLVLGKSPESLIGSSKII